MTSAAASGGPLRVERDGALVVLTMDRAGVLNAFDEALTAALADAVRDVASDEGVRALAITGAGRAFSSGQDLSDRAAALERGGDLRLGDELRRRFHPLVAAIRSMRKPVLAAVNGVVAGAGLGIAAACDLRVAAASATFRAGWGTVGLAPDAAAAYFLPRLVGWGRAADLTFTGRPVGADEALAIGLVSRVWPDDDFPREWRELAAALASGPTEAYALTKDALNAGLERELGPFLEIEASLQDRAGRTSDYAEGVRAFLEKRAPRFEGR